MAQTRFCWKLLWLFLLASGLALAQITAGTVSGTVRDSTGAVLPGATVTLKNTDTGTTRKAISDAAGRYSAPQLSLGSYEITAEAPGFQTVVRSGISLTVGREALVDFTLEVGTVSQQITVTGEAPLVESTNATVADLVSEKTMREIPLNGRSFTDLTQLQPGVVTDLGVIQNVFSGGGRSVINGARPQQSLYLLDGTDIVSPYQNLAPVSVMNQTLGVDTVREFTVIQNNYGAQYGRAIGGVVNAVTRSGTNTVHGSAFEFLRNSAVDSKNFFDSPSSPIPPFKRNQFGATLGGPIRRDRSFFFFSYEGLRERLGITDVATVLSDETRAGQITGCPASLRDCSKDQRIITGTVAINPNIVPIINLIPRANGSRYLQGGVQEYFGTRNQPGGENYAMFRLDHRLSDQDSLFGRMTIDNSHRFQPGFQFFPDGSRPSLNDTGAYSYLTLGWTRVMSASLLNVARFGLVRNNNRECLCIGETQKLADTFPNLPPQLQIVPGEPFGGPQTIPGVTFTNGANNFLGGDLNAPMRFVDNTFDYSDSVQITKGRHSFDIGGNIKRFQQNALISTWAHGQTNWLAPIDNFLTGGTCSGCGGIQQLIVTGVTQTPDNYRGWRQTYGAWYAQDDFRLAPKLTINVGLRWERVTGPVEVNGKTATLKNVLTDKEYTQLGSHSLFTLRDGWKGLAPRIGFAYGLDQKTSIRGGFGVFKEIPLEYLYQLGIYYPPYAERLALRNIRDWPNPLRAVDPAGATRQPLLVNYDYKYPSAYQWNFGVERQLGNSWVVKASYIGTRGLDLVGVVNQVQPVLSTDAQGERFTPLNAPSINPFLDSTRTYANIGDSWYNALQLRLQKRFSYGLGLSGSYTWSKNLSDVGIGLKTADLPTGISSGGYQIGNLWNYKVYDKGRADQDAPRNFIFDYSYELPLGKGRKFGSNMGKAAEILAGGWQINGIFSARSGLPVPLNGGGYNPASYCRTCIIRPNLKPGANNNPVIGEVRNWYDVTQFTTVRAGYFGNLGKNTLSGPDLVRVDFSVFKIFPIREGKTLQFRAEFFNLPNHPNFGRPDPQVFLTTGTVNPTAGRIQNTTGSSRQIQFALKFEF